MGQAGQANDPDLYRPAPHQADPSGAKVLAKITGTAKLTQAQIDAGVVLAPAAAENAAPGTPARRGASTQAVGPSAVQTPEIAPASIVAAAHDSRPSSRASSGGGSPGVLLLTLGLPLAGLVALRAFRRRPTA